METNNLLYSVKDYIEQQMYPFTLTHLLYFLAFTLITTVVSEYIFRWRLLKWIYVAIVIVTGATLFRSGDKKVVIGDIFKLATV
jgi:Ca2+-dependent lipid-binding protein